MPIPVEALECLLSKRDVRILEFLIDGPALFEHIKSYLESICERNVNDVQVLETHKIKSNQCLYMAISRLKNKGFLQTQRYRDGNLRLSYSLYCLSPEGVIELRRHKITPEYVRLGFPSPQTIIHELQVVSVARALRYSLANTRRISRYKIEDEIMLKRQMKGGRNKIGFPDFKVTYEAMKRNGERFVKTLAIEVDNDTITEKRVWEKAHLINARDSMPSIVLCTKTMRINALSRTVQHNLEAEVKFARDEKQSPEKINKIQSKQNAIFFALTSDFVRHGLFSTELQRSDARTAHLGQDFG